MGWTKGAINGTNTIYLGSQLETDAVGTTQPSTAYPLTSKNASDHLANERTFLAWVRTGLATITFGFVVERLPIPAPLVGSKLQPGLASWVPFSAIVGISLTVLGLALLNFLHIRANIDRDAFHPPVRFVVLLSILARLIGLFWRCIRFSPYRSLVRASRAEELEKGTV